MKKLMMLTFTVIFCLMLVVSANAGQVFDDDERFSIEIPDGYTYNAEMSSEGAYIFMTANQSDNIIISCDANDEKESVYNFDDEYIEEFKNALSQMLADQYTNLGIDVDMEFYDFETKKLANGRMALVGKTSCEIPSYNIYFYQKVYLLAGVDNLYTITYTCTDEENVDLIDNTVGKMVIYEDEMQGDGSGANQGPSLNPGANSSASKPSGDKNDASAGNDIPVAGTPDSEVITDGSINSAPAKDEEVADGDKAESVDEDEAAEEEGKDEDDEDEEKSDETESEENDPTTIIIIAVVAVVCVAIGVVATVLVLKKKKPTTPINENTEQQL